MAHTFDEILNGAMRFVKGIPRLLAAQSTTHVHRGVVLQADEADGGLHVKPIASVAGATATPVVGVPGLCPESLTQGIDPALPALLAQWVPLQPGVTLTVTLGAGPVVAAAIGQAVTISALVAGATTVAQVQAAIAAAPAVVPLLRCDGTPADVFGATYAGLPVTPLFAFRTATAGGWFGFCADGTWRPVRLLADGSIDRILVEVSGGAGATINIRHDGVIGGAIVHQLVFVADGPYSIDLADWPYANGLYVEINAGTATFNVLYW